MQVKVIPSSDANVNKFVFDFGDAVAEAVSYKYPTYEERTVICCSTQSGCPIGCRFCGAGDNFVRSLTGDEIVAQVDEVFRRHGLDPATVKRGQIMFMSMGEPMINRQGLGDAIPSLAEKYPGFALLVSTSAPRVGYEWFGELSSVFPQVGLQFSVHESTDAARDALIPFEAKLTLKEIAEEGGRWYAQTGRQPFFNYCAHPGNTSQDDVNRLVALFDPSIWQATISVICERDEHVAAANERQRDLAGGFAGKMVKAGYSTRCFNPAGQDDIGGGCGQLWFVQDWMRRHPGLARPTIGRLLPIVHTPN